MIMNRKLIAVALSCALSVVSLAGCKKNETVKGDYQKGEISYPIDTDVTLKYWVRLSNSVSTTVQNYAETEFAKECYKKTGIKVEFIHPAQGQEQEALNLLLASGDLPDIIETDWVSRNPEQMIENGTIIELNDIIKDYSPNLYKYLQENEDVDKQLKTDSGKYFAYPFIRNDEKLLATSGFMMRGDWLDELGLEVPETIDEWETVLTAFKEKKCDMPIGVSLGGIYQLSGGYNTKADFYLRDGKLVYGPTEDNFKAFVERMHEWYEKGIIDVNFVVLDGSLVNSNILSGKAGCTFGAGGSGLGMYLSNKPSEPADYTLIPVPYPTHEKGKTPEFGNKQLKYSPVNNAAITAQCKYPEIAARFLDFAYSEEGYMLNNFGIEGVSYEMKDGYPTYTDLITKNPEGLSMAQTLPLYTRASTEGPFIQDARYIEQYYQFPDQKKALDVWGANNDFDHIIPQISLTTDEAKEYNEIMNEVSTYCDEMVSKFIMGDEPIEKYDEFRNNIKAMGIDKATEIESAAIKRFNSR